MKLAAKARSAAKRVKPLWPGMAPYAGQFILPVSAKAVAARAATISSSTNPNCPNCKLKRLHGVSEWRKYHPEAGKGHSREHGAPLRKEQAK